MQDGIYLKHWSIPEKSIDPAFVCTCVDGV